MAYLSGEIMLKVKQNIIPNKDFMQKFMQKIIVIFFFFFIGKNNF